MERLEGAETQPVPLPSAVTGNSVVYWKARVRDLGQYALKVRSSNGFTHTKNISITRPQAQVPMQSRLTPSQWERLGF